LFVTLKFLLGLVMVKPINLMIGGAMNAEGYTAKVVFAA